MYFAAVRVHYFPSYSLEVVAFILFFCAMAFSMPEGHYVHPLTKLFQLFIRTLAFLFLSSAVSSTGPHSTLAEATLFWSTAGASYR